MDRLELIKLVSKLIAEGKNASTIVDEMIAALTPEDGEECPVCGICP
ncbi:MAG: hypothetical protein AB7O57_15315 [Hyphomicrobiaceae bacterium]